MKKQEKNYTVNKQEDEDGYILYPEKAIIYENGKREKDISSRNKAGNTEHGSAKLQSRSYTVSSR
jgi:hypothetical protein